MGSKVHVGNLPYSVTEEELRDLFSQAGKVISVSLPTDRYTGRPRGFGFVEMENPAEAEEAIRKFDGHTLQNRSLRVEMAKEREARPGYGSSSGERGEYRASGGRREA